MPRILNMALAVSGALILTPAAGADLLWSWQFSGEAGTFVTDGTLADLAGPSTFTFLDFDVSASTLPANVGANYIVDSGGLQWFDWNGTQPTQFYRFDGGADNGSNFFRAGSLFAYTLFAPPAIGILRDEDEEDITEGPLTIAAVREVQSIVAIPTLSYRALGLLALLVGAIGLRLVRGAA